MAKAKQDLSNPQVQGPPEVDPPGTATHPIETPPLAVC